MRGNGAVEVRKSHTSNLWYNATLVDVTSSGVKVEFENSVWPGREYPLDCVRRAPQKGEGFAAKVDDLVEVLVVATEANPSGWALGKVKTIKNKTFYFVSFEGVSREKGQNEVIVEASGLRKANTTACIDAGSIVRRQVPVDRLLHGWIKSEDSVGCLQEVQVKGGLLSVSCAHATKPDAKGAPKVSLLGDEHSVQLGEKLLLHVHFKHQMLMQRFNTQREQMLEKIKGLESQWSAENKDCFPVDNSFIGRIIGKQGANILRLREAFDVEIHIPRDNRWEETWITVTGKSAEAVRRARDEIEYVTERVEIEKDQVGFFVGKGYKNLSEISEKAELAYARFDDKSSSIELCGLQSQVEAAKMMITVHRDYLPVYQDMGQERDEIQAQFTELDSKDTKGKGRKGKGQGKKGDQSLPAPSEERDGSKGKAKGKGKAPADDEESAKAKGKGKAPADDEESAKGKGKGKGKAPADDDKGKAKAKGKPPSDDDFEGKAKRKGKRISDDEEDPFGADPDTRKSKGGGRGKPLPDDDEEEQAPPTRRRGKGSDAGPVGGGGRGAGRSSKGRGR